VISFAIKKFQVSFLIGLMIGYFIQS